MSEDKEENIVLNNSFDEILGSDIVDKLLKDRKEKLSDKEIENLKKEALGSVDFMKAIEKIEIPKDNYVVFTDGDEQLLYENGEFYVISTTDTPNKRKKKNKREATEMYLNYFINYQLNGLLGESKSKAVKPVKKKTNTTKQVQRKEEVAVEEQKMEQEVVKKAEEKEIEL